MAPSTFSVSDIPFNRQDLQMLTKRSLEARVPYISGLPISRCDGRTDEVVHVGDAADSREGIDHRLELVEIV